jgi:hypothetical protein
MVMHHLNGVPMGRKWRGGFLQNATAMIVRVNRQPVPKIPPKDGRAKVTNNPSENFSSVANIWNLIMLLNIPL